MHSVGLLPKEERPLCWGENSLAREERLL